MGYTVYHNPRCSKSRLALAYLEDQGLTYDLRLYLKEPFSKEELNRVLMQLNMKPADLIRKNEAIYKKDLKSLTLTDEEWVDVMLENPKLIERPIVVKDYKAVVARPAERIAELEA